MDLYDDARQLPWRLGGEMTSMTVHDLRAGGTSAKAVRCRTQEGRLTRAHRGIYLSGPTEPDLLDRIRAALAVCSPTAVVGHHTAAALLGFGVVESEAVHIVVPAGGPFPQRPGIAVHQSVIAVAKPAEVLGIPCTPAARCAIDLARGLPRLDALPVLDAALRAGACTADELTAELALYDRLRNIRQARDLVSLADPRPQCRQESQLRLVVHDGGLKGFQPQLPVNGDDGHPRHYLDLGDPEALVGAEYDGATHFDRQRLRHDRARHNWLESRGWRMRYFTDDDLCRRPQRILETLIQARLTGTYARPQ
jgi:very-short-patch-repair endonuclease